MYTGWQDLRSNLGYQPWDDRELPRPEAVIGEGGVAYVPDATAVREGVLHIVEAMRAEEFRGTAAVARLRAFARHAHALDARLRVFVDGWGAYDASAYLTKHGIDAEVVMWEGMYRYEYEDALAADGWRDMDWSTE